MATSLMIGGGDRESAKRRRKEEYKQDLELQIRERDAARQREKLQDMSVNASGWLDPEKRPERLKPLGGVHWTQERGVRTDRVKPYHTLFLYGREPARVPRSSGEVIVDRSPSASGDQLLPPVKTSRLDLHGYRWRLTTPPGLKYQPTTYAGGSAVQPNSSVDQAYSFFGTQDLRYGYGGGGSIVQPISIPYVDNRPIIVTGPSGASYPQGPRFNPFEHKSEDGAERELRVLLSLTQAEKERMRRDNEDFQRRLRQELEDEKRKLSDQEVEARKRLEEMRREAEVRRKEADRQRLEAERLKRLQEIRPQSNPPPRPASKKSKLYYDMDDYRQRLIDERKQVEELLKADKPAPKQKETWNLRVIQKLPPTPKSADRANRDNVHDFNDLKYRDFNARGQFRNIYPDIPVTNRRLEEQQEALLRQQEAATLKAKATNHKRSKVRDDQIEIPPRRAISRPSWLDRSPTPFPHVLRKRDRLYAAASWDGDLDRIQRRTEQRDRFFGQIASRNDDSVLDELRLRHHRPASTETLTDDTWLRPSSTAQV